VHAALEVDSMMSLLVYTDDCRFDADDVAVAEALAGNLSVVMAAEKQIGQLGLALHNRTLEWMRRSPHPSGHMRPTPRGTDV
jgi:hypothetical protein